jgi:cell division septal protein FtsQ
MRKNRLQKKKSSLKRKIFAGLFFCLLAGLIYFFIFWSGLWIEKIEVRENKSVSFLEIKNIVQKELAEKLWQIIPQKSIILAPINRIKEDILNNFPEIRTVSINKKIPNLLAHSGAGLEIVIEERKSIGIWCQIEREDIIAGEDQGHSESFASLEDRLREESRGETSGSFADAQDDSVSEEPIIKKCFYIDKEGIIYKESPLISGSLVLNIYSARNQSAGIRTKVASPEMIDFILTLKEKLPKIKTADGPSLQINNFKIVSLEDLRVNTSQDWQIYFSPAYSIDSQLKTLETVLEKEIKETTSLEYIDLRIENRVYYR